MTQQSQNEMPCLICGERSYSWGIAQAGENVNFKGDDAGFWAKATVFGGEEVRARKCNSCGNVQLFVRSWE